MCVRKPGSEQLNHQGTVVLDPSEEFHSAFLTFPVTFPSHCVGLLVNPELALSCWSSAASFSPPKQLQKSVPQPQVMNKAALPLAPRALFLGCYTECVLLAEPVMDVGLPLSLCLPDKEGISLN